MKSYTINMTEGPIWGPLSRYLWPLLAMMVLNLAYQYADSIILSLYGGDFAFGSVDAVGNILYIFMGALMGLGSGGAILAGRAFGAGEHRRVGRFAEGMLFLGCAYGLLLALVGLALALPLMRFLNVPPEMMGHSRNYLTVIFVGQLVQGPMMMSGLIMNSVGNSRSPFYIMLTSNIINVFLTLFFVAHKGWGAGGAALGTVCSQVVGLGLSLRVLHRLPHDMAPRLKGVRPNSELVEGLKLGLPLCFQRMIYPLANILVRRQINSLGALTVSGFALNNLLVTVLWGLDGSFSTAMDTFMSQNYGKGSSERLERGLRAGLGLWAAMMVPLSILLFISVRFFGGFIMPDPQVVDVAAHLARTWFIPFYTLAAAATACRSWVVATGHSKIAAGITLCFDALFKSVWATFVFPLIGTGWSLFMAYPLGWISASLVFVIVYFYLKNKVYAHLTLRREEGV